MDKRLIKLLGEGPYPTPVERAGELMDFHYYNKILIAVPKTAFDIPNVGTHVHESYEFGVPLTLSPVLRLEKRNVLLEKNKLYPFNTGQIHGTAGPLSGVRLIGIQIDKEFIQETARLVYGKTEIYFVNDNYEFNSDLRNLIRLFMEETKSCQAGFEFILQSLSTQIVVNLLRHIKNNMPVLVNERNYTEIRSINRVIEFFMEQYNKDYSLEEVAGLANISPYHFIRVFKAHMGKTPYQYLMDIKIAKAKELLGNRRYLTITEICYMSGFNNLSHFSAVFKRKTGVSPSAYRKVLLGTKI